MRLSLLLVLPLCLALMGLFAACTNSPESPATPASDSQGDSSTVANDVIALGHGLVEAPLGRWNLQVTGETARLTPLRTGAATVGQLFAVDLTEAMSDSICHDCLRVSKIKRFGNTVYLTFELRHPFPLADDTKPPSAGNRRDLWVSTVKLIQLIDGTESFFDGAAVINRQLVEAEDGYTNLLPAQTGFSATLFPYKTFYGQSTGGSAGNFDPSTGWSAHLDDPTGYAILANGLTREAQLWLGVDEGETVDIDVMLVGTFCVSAPTLEDRLAPTYYMPAGAPPEAWKVGAETDLGGVSLDAADPNASITVHLDAYDWQQDPALAVDPGFPNPANPRGLAVSSRIGSVQISMPDILLETVEVDISGATGTGIGNDEWTVDYELFNERKALSGYYWGLVKFIDERSPSGGTAPLGPTTFIGADLQTPFTSPTEFATYATLRIEVDGPEDCDLGPGDLASGDYPENTITSQVIAGFDNQTDFQAGWDTFFVNSATRPPLPTVDFVANDVIFYSLGYTPYGFDQRSITVVSSCTRADLGYVILDGVVFEVDLDNCTPPGASHPWTLVPVPKGGADWIVDDGMGHIPLCP